MHTLAAGATAVSGDHGAVSFLIKHNAQLTEPVNSQGSLGYQLFQKLGDILIVAAAKGVQIVGCRGIVSLVGSLNAALSHHGVGVAHA